MIVGFASSMSGKAKPADLAEEIMKSKTVIQAEIREGNNGLLVDTFHTGSVVGDQNFLLLRRDSLSRVFEEVVKNSGAAVMRCCTRRARRWGAKLQELHQDIRNGAHSRAGVLSHQHPHGRGVRSI